MNQKEAILKWVVGEKVRACQWAPRLYFERDEPGCTLHTDGYDVEQAMVADLFSKSGEGLEFEIYEEKSIDPGEGYRLLDKGEKVMWGDEALLKNGWGAPGNWRGGMQAKGRTYRRKIGKPLMGPEEVRFRLADGGDARDISIEAWERKMLADNFLAMEYTGSVTTCALCVSNEDNCSMCIPGLAGCNGKGSPFGEASEAYDRCDFRAFCKAAQRLIDIIKADKEKPKGLRLEVGAWYERRDGKHVGPVKENPAIDAGSWAFIVDGLIYDHRGRWSSLGNKDHRDLIRKLTPEERRKVDRPTMDFSVLPAWAVSITMDRNGRWKSHTREPKRYIVAWSSAEACYIPDSYAPKWDGDWKDSLTEVQR